MLNSLVLGAQEVELVGGEGWLEHSSVAIAAIFAAALAALVAILNRRAQLEHDRYLRNRDYVRDTIDNAIMVANEVRTAIVKFHVHLTTLEDHRDNIEPGEVDEEQGLLEEEREQAMVHIREMRAARSRLEIRFEITDSLPETYDATLVAFVELLQETHWGIEENRSEEVREADAQREVTVGAAFDAFQCACRDWLDEPPQRRIWIWGRKKAARDGEEPET